MIKRTLAPILFAALFVSFSAISQADLVLVFEGNHDGTFAQITNGANGSETINLDSSFGDGLATASYQYTISGIDAAGDGTANDSLTAIFNVAAAGGNVRFQTDGNFGVTGNNAGNLNAASESLTFTLQSSSVSLGDAGSGSITGGGFNRIAFTLLGTGETALLSGGTSADGSISAATFFDPTSTFTVGHNDDGSSFRVGPARYRFVITAASVPEPSSSVLFCGLLAGFGLRRKRQS